MNCCVEKRDSVQKTGSVQVQRIDKSGISVVPRIGVPHAQGREGVLRLYATGYGRSSNLVDLDGAPEQHDGAPGLVGALRHRVHGDRKSILSGGHILRPRRRGAERRHATLTASNNEVQMLRVRERMGHHHWWRVLQRLLRTSANRFDCWLYPFDPALRHCDVHILSRHRNLLHYGLAWFHDDLFDNQIIESFAGSIAVAGDGVVENLGEDTSNGTLTLNQSIVGECPGDAMGSVQIERTGRSGIRADARNGPALLE